MQRPQWRRACFAAITIAVTASAASAAWIMVPPAASVIAPPSQLGITLTDRNGIPLRDTRAAGGERWRWVPLSEIDPVVAAAFIAAEDRRFLDHTGVAWGSFLRALRDNAAAGRVVSGASTITMQLARMLRGHSRGVVGKMQQVAWAIRLERHLSKDLILEQYLNRVPLGQGTVGVEAASQLYFATSSSRVGAGRAALLAGIARSPARNNPFASTARAAVRRSDVLSALERSGYLSAADRVLADAEPVTVKRGALTGVFHAPHFTTQLLAQLDSSATTERVVAAAKTGSSDARERNTIATRLRTTLDLALQQEIERDTRQIVQSLRESQVEHAAVVVLDNASGDVLAWVGSPDFFGERGQVDMVVSERQPGSALKPFLYALAFEKGYSPSSILDDIPQSWMTSTGPYRPRNYDRQFRGPVRARVALASSLNVPAVQLTDRVGARALLDVLHNAGFASLTRSADYYGLGLSLGNGDVTLLELANAYRTLANGGLWSPTERLRDRVESTVPSRQVYSAEVAAVTLDILSDADARLSGFGSTNVFDFPFPAAVKTGTSRHFTDNWAVGVTGAFTVAVWVGNFDGTPMASVSGIAGAGPLLRRAMLATAARVPAGLLTSPDQVGATRIRVCRLSGMLAHDACDAVDEWQLSTQPIPALDDWQQDGSALLPLRFAEWQRTNHRRDLALVGGVEGRARDTSLTLISPRDGDVYFLPTGPARAVATVALRAVGAGSSTALRWMVDDSLVTSNRWSLEAGAHVIRVRTESGHEATARITVRDPLQ